MKFTYLLGNFWPCDIFPTVVAWEIRDQLLDTMQLNTFFVLF